MYYGYDLLGRPTYAGFNDTASENLNYSWNALSRLTSATQIDGGASRTLSYLYDAAGRRTRVTWPDGGHAAYAYDAAGRPTAVTDSAGATLRSYTYDAAGRLTGEAMGAGAAAGSFGYSGSTSRLASLGRDLAGSALDATDTFAWSPSGQLASETRSNDAYAWTAHANADRNYTSNGLNQYTAVGAAAFTHDANGNLTSDGTNTYAYDAENRLASKTGGTSASLRYDPLGRLYEIAANGAATRLLHDGDALVGEYDTAGTLLRRFAHGPGAGDDPIAWYEGSAISSATRRFLHADRLGSIVSVIGDNGAAIAINTYDEYGVPGAGNLGRFQYTGQVWLPEVGLYYYKARMYSPGSKHGARFLQTDPIGYGDGMNMYAYVGNDPVNFVDPGGLASTDCAPRYPGEMVACGDRDGSWGFGWADVIPDKYLKYDAPEAPDDGACAAPPLTHDELNAQARGDREDYWTSRENRGDPLGRTGIAIVRDKSPFGRFANGLLEGSIERRNSLEGRNVSFPDVQKEANAIGVEIMRAHTALVRSSNGSFTAVDVADYHIAILKAHRLPATSFGGTMATGSPTEARLTKHVGVDCP